MNKIKAVIFDMDGLMFDTETAYSKVHNAMWKRRGKEFTKEIKMLFMGKRAEEVMEAILNDHWRTDESVTDLLKEQDEELIKIYKQSVEKLKGLDNLLKHLNTNRLRKCIGTSSRRFLTDILLRKHDLESEFEFIISGDIITKGKPDPEIYNTCIKKLGLNPKECLVLEDSLNGVKAANFAGCSVCAIPSEYTVHEDFSKADLICESLADPKLLKYIFQ